MLQNEMNEFKVWMVQTSELGPHYSAKKIHLQIEGEWHKTRPSNTSQILPLTYQALTGVNQ